MPCPNCGTANFPGDVFCRRCGFALQSAPPFQPVAQDAPPAFQAQTHQAAPPPAYERPAGNPEGEGRHWEPITYGQWMGTILISLIPILGWIYLLAWAFSRRTNPSKASWARVTLTLWVITLLFGGIAGGLFWWLRAPVVKTNPMNPGGQESSLLIPTPSPAAETAPARILGKSVQSETDTQKVDLSYPQVQGLADGVAEKRINQILFERFGKAPAPTPEEGAEQATGKTECSGSFKVQLNMRGLLSIVQSESSYSPGAAHPLSGQSAITLDLASATQYNLEDMLQGDWRRFVTQKIKADLDSRWKKDFQEGTHEFTELASPPNFYLTQDSLVIFFNPYEVGPYAWGIQEVAIPYRALQPYIRTDGPLGILTR